MRKLAVVLFNLGGPDGPDAVRPFLFNLFNDPAIISLPRLARWPLARLISGKRAPLAREIYANLGGGSPLLPNTVIQARALEAALTEILLPEQEAKAFVAMRYWHPMSDEVARAVVAYGPDEIVLLPLYPQYSTTTTGSSLKDWYRAARKAGLAVPTRAVCCYPREAGFVADVADLVAQALADAPPDAGLRVLFSAHGLPKKIVDGGDPYQWQVEQSVAAILEVLREDQGLPSFDAVVCYQSRVGPLEWIGPSTEDEIACAGAEGKALVVVPVAFVSEHSETLVELDIEYGALARAKGVVSYQRVPTVDAGTAYIAGLARLVTGAIDRQVGISSGPGERLCPGQWSRCPLAKTG